MDTLVRRYRSFACAYIDDVVIFLRTLTDHLQHLNYILELFANLQITLSTKKSYISFPSV